MITRRFDVQTLNRWQRQGLVCVVCERMFTPGQSSVVVGTADGGPATVRACQGCATDMSTPNKRGRCVQWLTGQCHADHHCRCVPMPPAALLGTDMHHCADGGRRPGQERDRVGSERHQRWVADLKPTPPDRPGPTSTR